MNFVCQSQAVPSNSPSTTTLQRKPIPSFDGTRKNSISSFPLVSSFRLINPSLSTRLSGYRNSSDEGRIYRFGVVE